MLMVQVLNSVETLAGVSRHSLKLKKGDRAVIYMPMWHGTQSCDVHVGMCEIGRWVSQASHLLFLLSIHTVFNGEPGLRDA